MPVTMLWTGINLHPEHVNVSSRLAMHGLQCADSTSGIPIEHFFSPYMNAMKPERLPGCGTNTVFTENISYTFHYD